MRLCRRVLMAVLAVALAACAGDDTSNIRPTTSATRLPPAARGWVVATASGLDAIAANGTVTTLVDGPVVTVAVGPDGTIWFQRASILFGRTEATTSADTRVLAYDRVTRTVRDAVVPAPSPIRGWARCISTASPSSMGGRTWCCAGRCTTRPGTSSCSGGMNRSAATS